MVAQQSPKLLSVGSNPTGRVHGVSMFHKLTVLVKVIKYWLRYLMRKFLDFLYALFFTRDDDLDSLQVLFAAIIIVTLMICWKIIIPTDTSENIRIEGLITLRWLTSLLVITAVPKWLVPFMISHVRKTNDQLIVKKDTIAPTNMVSEVIDEATEETS